MRRGLVARGEDAGAFERDVDAELLVRQLGRILDRRHLDLVAADVDRVAVDARLHAGKRPCTLSKRSRWALVSTGPRSLIATTSMSLRPDSTIARRTIAPDASEAVDRNLRDHRELSLTPVTAKCGRQTAFLSESSRSSKPGATCPFPRLKSSASNGECDNSPIRRGPGLTRRAGRAAALGDRFGRDAEDARRAPCTGALAPKPVMPMNGPSPMIASQPWRTAASTADLDLRRADHRAAIVVRLVEERVHAGHGDDAGGDRPCALSSCLRGDRDRDFRARGEDRHRGWRRRPAQIS